ncbi:TNF receptor-associated factor 1-like [Haemaphysalis longicornis]
MASRCNMRQNRHPALKREQRTSIALRKARDGAVVQGTTIPQSPGADARTISELRRKLNDVCREVKAIKDALADLEDIRNTVSALQETVRNEMKKMREESAAISKRILLKVEKIHHYLRGESEPTKDQPRSSKFEWRVQNFKLKEKMLAAKAKYFCSDTFYVGSHGYKMHLGATLSEKNSKGKVCLSVYTHITRGPYDRTLQWPYRRRSTFIVVDQKSNHHHKVAEMVPQELGRKQEHCFQRPKGGPNEGIGFTALLSLEELEDPEKGYLMKDSFLVHFITSDM